MKRLIQHARRIPRGFRYTRRGLLLQREARLQGGSVVEEIVGRIEDPFEPSDPPGWNGAGADVDGRDLEVGRG